MQKTALFSLFAALFSAPVMAQAGQDGAAKYSVVEDTVMGRLLFPPPAGESILTGGDGAISIAIDSTRSLWLWGDSFVDTVSGKTRASALPSVFGNVFVLLDGDKATTVCGGAPEHLQPVISAGPVDGHHSVYWPHHGFIKDGTLHLFCANVVFGGSGMWDFHMHTLAYFRLTYPGFAVIGKEDMAAYPINKADYGYGIFEEGGYYYVYGTKEEDSLSALHVARARLTDGKLQWWEYFDGRRWRGDPSKTQALKGIDVAVSTQFSVFRHNGRYILLTQEKGIGTNDIYTFVSDTPTGPWTSKKKIYTTPEPLDDRNLFSYNAMAHPQYDDDGMLLVSYCINMYRPSENVSDYRPRFIRVPYELILEE